ncbi:uncharacterized protein CLUP02_07271 [Colletotrichum lupini]|uniref:Uncharacterized protein n=1 Tax=Colletotrichum lupini TaxID=145971 RepID=A0A9Q8WGI2_9PEZI|nr:uncharacterized protein CLUP02_07271 [Colletotrichum lupini]UQC81785.1 hypothetical protein CLUP02_07271 [Colletotrichum lupini]
MYSINLPIPISTIPLTPLQNARMPLLARHGSSRRVYSPALLCHPGVNNLIDRHTAGVRRTSSKKKLWSSFHMSESYQEPKVHAARPEFQPRHMSLSHHSALKRAKHMPGAELREIHHCRDVNLTNWRAACFPIVGSWPEDDYHDGQTVDGATHVTLNFDTQDTLSNQIK